MEFKNPLLNQTPERLKKLQANFFSSIPHARELGIEVTDIGPARGTLKIPYRDVLIGDPRTGIIHGGVITSLIDSSCGLAVFAALPRMEAIATLDLRIDYMKPAQPKLDIYAFSECYKLTRQIAFVRSIAYQDDINDPVATSVSAFMRASSKLPPITPKQFKSEMG